MEKKKISKLGSIQMRMDEDNWLSQVREYLTKSSTEVQEEVDQILQIKPSICKIPKDMAAASPQSFAPQCISIGPYHRGKAELYPMERYKLAAARFFYYTLPDQAAASSSFEKSVVQKMEKRKQDIRNGYDSFIDCRDETLVWLVAVDAIFLLNCLQVYAGSAGEALGRVLDLVALVSVVKDVVKLENQIPLFTMEILLELHLGEKAAAEAPKRLADILAKALAKLSPLALAAMTEALKNTLPSRAHLLDALYFSVVPATAAEAAKDKAAHIAEELQQTDPEEEPREKEIDKEKVIKTLGWFFRMVSSLKVKPVKHVVSAFQTVSKVSLKILGSLGRLPILKGLTGPLAGMLPDEASAAKKDDDADATGASVRIEIPPTRAELAVPSVGALQKAGVRFAVAADDVGVRGVSFDRRSRTLFLPALCVDAHTEVVIRNLIAYEASLGGAMQFTRFVDFVNGIVDGADDVRILRKCGVLRHHLQSDLEVANLCNGMGACVKLTHVDYLDAVVREVNAFYRRTWSVKLVDLLDSYVFGSWQMLSLLAAMGLLALTCLQTFCSVYECKKWLDPDAFQLSSVELS